MVHKKIMAVLASGFLCFSFSSYANEGPDAPKEEVLPFAAAVKSNGKWGAVDGSGQQVIPLSYDKVGISLSDPDVKDDDADSEPGRENLVEVEEKGLRGFYNRQGHVVVPVSYETRSVWKDGALAVQGKDKRISFYRKDGTKISDKTFEQVSDFQNDMAIVKAGGKYGYLSIDGKEIAPVYQEARYFEDGLAPVRSKGRWGVIDREGKEVVAPHYKDAGPSYSDGLLAVEDNQNNWGFIDGKGQEVVPTVYKAVVPVFSEHMTAVEDAGKLWGFMNNEGQITAKPQFKAVLTPFSEGLAGVKTTDGNGYARSDGTIAFMAEFDKLYPFEEGLAEVRTGEVGETAVMRRFPVTIGIGWGWGHWCHHHHHYHHPFGWGIGFPVWDPWYYDYETVPTIRVQRGYIDSSGRVIASPSNDRVFKRGEKGILIRNNGRYGWVNKEGTFIAHTVYPGLIPEEEDHVLLAQNDSKKWGILSMDNGSTLVPFSYDSFSALGNGIYGYKLKDRWGLISKDGTVITEPVFRALSREGDGLIPVKTKEGWKFAGPDGKDRITFQEEASDVTPFHDGRAGVKIRGKWGLIDTTGRFVVKPSYDDLDIL